MNPDPHYRLDPAEDDGAGGASRNRAALITGANGEFGHGLIRSLYDAGRRDIVALDVRELDPELRSMCRESFVGDIVDDKLLDRLLATYEIHTIYHLAALLSTRAEFTPEAAHMVNVNGTLNLLKLAANQASSHAGVVKFLFPSSIAVYGLPDLDTKRRAGRVKEGEHLTPTTMYGCNKLACEHLGRYYARHYRQLAKDRPLNGGRVDFRSIRFPGVISAFTTPSGGTSDYAPEMIHAAAQGRPYACFVREDARIPFITMPDAIRALLALGEADADSLTHCVYNIGGFNPSAGEIADIVRRHFETTDISFAPDLERQGIVDTWPEDVDDAAARHDWGYAFEHDLDEAFETYLIPNIRAKYAE
ncbi:MAG: NAD-dependent epimerase/dehydratase family protein [Phycisphaerales bacterium]